MILNLYAIYDTKAAAYVSPFFEVNNAVAMRRFEDLVNDPRSPIAKHSEDYILFGIGQFDDSTGVIAPLPAPVNLVVGSDVKKGQVANA